MEGDGKAAVLVVVVERDGDGDGIGVGGDNDAVLLRWHCCEMEDRVIVEGGNARALYCRSDDPFLVLCIVFAVLEYGLPGFHRELAVTLREDSPLRVFHVDIGTMIALHCCWVHFSCCHCWPKGFMSNCRGAIRSEGWTDGARSLKW